MSLCLIAATIGKPFIDFVLDEARWWMKTRKLREDSDRPTPANRELFQARKGIVAVSLQFSLPDPTLYGWAQMIFRRDCRGPCG
jgi:hypothetical protein